MSCNCKQKRGTISALWQSTWKSVWTAGSISSLLLSISELRFSNHPTELKAFGNSFPISHLSWWKKSVEFSPPTKNPCRNMASHSLGHHLTNENGSVPDEMPINAAAFKLWPTSMWHVCHRTIQWRTSQWASIHLHSFPPIDKFYTIKENWGAPENRKPSMSQEKSDGPSMPKD